MSACPNQPPTNDLEPFIVEAKVLRPGFTPPTKKPVSTDTVVRWIEAIIILPFTVVAAPLAIVGLFVGLVGLVSSPAWTLMFAVPAAIGLWGLLALWDLLVCEEKVFVENRHELRFAVWGVCVAILLDLLFSFAPGNVQPLWRFYIATPSIVALHRLWRLAMAMGWLGGGNTKQ